MAENRFQASKNGKIIPDGVNVFLSGGQVFEGWTDVSIQKNLESIANQFSLTIDNRFIDANSGWNIKPGVDVRVNIGDERVVTGRIETLDVSFQAGSRSYKVSGRSFAGDLIDCTVDGATEYQQLDLIELAEQLVKPFGLKVFSSVTTKKIEKFGVRPGETVFEALNRAARLQGYFWISTREGNIRLTRSARARAFSALEQDVNIVSANLSIDNSQRFSKYVVKGQTQGLPNFNGENASEASGTAFDSGIKQNRPLLIIAEGSVDSDTAQTRAEWEASNRIARGLEVNVNVQGWRQADGSLWGINQLVKIRSKFLGIDADMLTTSVEHQMSNSGTITNMTLVRPDSFEPQPVIKEKDDILTRIGESQ